MDPLVNMLIQVRLVHTRLEIEVQYMHDCSPRFLLSF